MRSPSSASSTSSCPRRRRRCGAPSGEKPGWIRILHGAPALRGRPMILVIANKNYSSWSMRPWVLLRQAQIPFEEVQLKFGDDNKPEGIERYSPTRKVPVLILDGG